MGGDFLWTLDPDIAATMVAAMVVSVDADNKIFVKSSSSGRDRKLPSVSPRFEQKASQDPIALPYNMQLNSSTAMGRHEIPFFNKLHGHS